MSAAAPVSTLSDVLVNVIALLAAVGDVRDPNTNPAGLELLVGERYLSQEGAPPRIVFVRTADGGELGPVLEIGARQVAGLTETVRCYIWGAETADDTARTRDAEARAHRLINSFRQSIPGRMRGRLMKREQGTNIVTFGEEYVLTVSYSYGIPLDDDILAAAIAAAPSPRLSPPDPDRPEGSTGQTIATSPTFRNRGS